MRMWRAAILLPPGRQRGAKSLGLTKVFSDYSNTRNTSRVFIAAKDPQRSRQRGEVRQQREHEGGGGDDAELAHRRQVRHHQRQKAAGVDQGREQNRAAGDQQGMSQGAGGRTGGPAFLKMVEEMDLVV